MCGLRSGSGGGGGWGGSIALGTAICPGRHVEVFVSGAGRGVAAAAAAGGGLRAAGGWRYRWYSGSATHWHGSSAGLFLFARGTPAVRPPAEFTAGAWPCRNGPA